MSADLDQYYQTAHGQRDVRILSKYCNAQIAPQPNKDDNYSLTLGYPCLSKIDSDHHFFCCENESDLKPEIQPGQSCLVDFSYLPFPNNFFQNIFVSHIHLEPGFNLDKFCDELYRVLMAECHAHFYIPLSMNPFKNHRFPGQSAKYSLNQWLSSLRKSGFSVSFQKSLFFYPKAPKGFDKTLDLVFEKICPELASSAFITVQKKVLAATNTQKKNTAFSNTGILKAPPSKVG